MNCIYEKTKTYKIGIGDGILDQITYCQLKMKSETMKVEIYSKLFELNLEGSGLTEFCPVTDEGNWDACPFRKI